MQYLTAPLLNALNIRHGFFTRNGGVSEGIYNSLNCGSGSKDNPDHVHENRQRVLHSFSQHPHATLHTCYQVHSATVLVKSVDSPRPDVTPADAMVTNHPDVYLGILTADCVPVLFMDADAGVVGAAHAGWKGAFGGVVENTVTAMEKLGAYRARIKAAVGPCIQQGSYEVGPEFYEQFMQRGDHCAAFFVKNIAGKYQFNLPAFVLEQLQNAGIAQAESLGIDTYSNPSEFFSYRRSIHHNEPDYGRFISVIGIISEN